LRKTIGVLSGILLFFIFATVVVFAFVGQGLFRPTKIGVSADKDAARLEVVYPSDGSIFPPEFVAPTFIWRDRDSRADRWVVSIAGKDDREPLRFKCQGDPPPPGEIDEQCISKTNEIYVPYVKDGPVHAWTPNTETWERIKRKCGHSAATVDISGVSKEQPEKVLSSGRITISVSKDPVGSPIFYRDVPLCPTDTERGIIQPLPEGTLPLIRWRLRDVSKEESRVVMKDIPTCANCHTFSGDGRTLGLDIDGPDGDKGTYGLASIEKNIVIEKENLITWNSFPNRPKGKKTIGFMSAVSPDGRHVVTTVNEDVFVTNFIDYKFVQVFYPTRGILAYYSSETGQMKAFPGADDPEYVHCNPTWSPDGEYIVFARAKARDAYPDDGVLPKYANDPKELPIKYDLYRIPFRDGKGGTPEPIQGASDNGMSNTFPKISPDGRWIVWVKCRNGQLMRPDSRLWIVPASGGEAREMRCNTSLMNSWHSFSPNGRWMVFSSKCNTPYTQMFLTHVDEQGQDSPAVLIPNSTAANRAVNLPEFANIHYDELVNIDVPAVDWRRAFDRGVRLLEKDKPRQALRQFKESIRIDPLQERTHFLAGNILKDMGLFDEAVEHYAKVLEITPEHADAHCNLGFVLRRQGKVDLAIEHYEKAIEINPRLAAAHTNLGTALISLGKVDLAVEHFRQAVELDSMLDAAGRNLDRALIHQDKLRQAVKFFKEAVKNNPKDVSAHRNLDLALRKAGKFEEVIIHWQEAVDSDPENVQFRLALSNALAEQGNFQQAVVQSQKAVELDPKSVAAANDLAWLLATCPKDDLRDGARAVELAERAHKYADREMAPLLDTLAAAYASAGRFPEAAETATKALGLAEPKQGSLAEQIRRRLELYKAGKPYRQ